MSQLLTLQSLTVINCHCVKSINILRFCGSYFPVFSRISREYTDQKNTEFGHFSRSVHFFVTLECQNIKRVLRKPCNMVRFLKQCGGQFYIRFLLIVKLKFFVVINVPSMNSSSSLLYLFLSLVLKNFWQLRFEYSLKQTRY